MLTTAATGTAFDNASGLPASMTTGPSEISWLDHCIDFLAMKWPDAAPKYRKSLEESLTALTMAVLPSSHGGPPTPDLRAGLYQ
jgi:hypothetical protein